MNCSYDIILKGMHWNLYETDIVVEAGFQYINYGNFLSTICTEHFETLKDEKRESRTFI